MGEYTYIYCQIRSCRGHRGSGILTAMSIPSTPILVSKYYFPIKGTWALRRNGRLQEQARGKNKMNLKIVSGKKSSKNKRMGDINGHRNQTKKAICVQSKRKNITCNQNSKCKINRSPHLKGEETNLLYRIPDKIYRFSTLHKLNSQSCTPTHRASYTQWASSKEWSMKKEKQ